MSSPKKLRADQQQQNTNSSSSQQQEPTTSLHGDIVPVQIHAAKGASIEGMKAYKKMYDESIKDPAKFWGKLAKTNLVWEKEFDNVCLGSFQDGDISWFQGGRLNACVQCLDRHVWNEQTANKPAIIWEGDEIGTGKTFTFKEVLHETCRIANMLKSFGVKAGDAITIYMPMMPEAAFTMLACARLGAPHSIVFAGFSAEALRDRVSDVQSKFVFTSDEGLRGGKIIPLKNTVDDALKSDRCRFVEKVFIFKRTHSTKINFVEGRDVWMNEELPKHAPYCPATGVDSEHPLFYLYTSGSTGKPKGVQHTTAGYMLCAQTTFKYVFDPRPGDVHGCMADVGWITGANAVIYGPLANATTTVMFESTPLYPDAGRYWHLVEKHKINIFYTAPTAIRALMREDISYVKKYNLSSLRVLGSVGEPIGPAPWRWYFENIGMSRCPVLDTYWLTGPNFDTLFYIALTKDKPN
jgi:acetyl-CoA synthetase